MKLNWKKKCILLLAKRIFAVLYLRSIPNLKMTLNMFSIKHTCGSLVTLWCKRHKVNTQIMPCKWSFRQRLFFHLLSDCDLLSLHSSALSRSLAQLVLLGISNSKFASASVYFVRTWWFFFWFILVLFVCQKACFCNCVPFYSLSILFFIIIHCFGFVLPSFPRSSFFF